jgi:AcrR family transcriptional regulator
MATARFENLPEEKQSQILDAAAEEFAENSYETASINRIIELAGISKGSMYYYFEGKADLYETVVENATRRLMALVGDFEFDSLQSDNFWPYIEAFSERTLHHMRSQGKYLRLVRNFYQLYQPGDPDSPGSGMVDWGRDMVEALLIRGRQVGAIRRDLPTELLVQLMMAIGMVFDQWLLEHLDEFERDDSDLLEKEVELLRLICEPRKEDENE